MPQTIKLEDAPKRLRLKKMQIAGFKAKASKDGRVLVGFYKDKDGKTKPITRSIREINRKKVVKHGKQFRGVKPQSMHVDEESQEYVQSLPLKKNEFRRTIRSRHLNEILSAMLQWEGYKKVISVSKLFNDVLRSSEFDFADGSTKRGIRWNTLTTDERKYVIAHLKNRAGKLKVKLAQINVFSKTDAKSKSGTVWSIRRVFFSKGAHVVTAHPLASFKIRNSKDIKKANLAFKELCEDNKDDRSTERVFMQDNHGGIIRNRRFPRKRYSPPLSEVVKPVKS